MLNTDNNHPMPPTTTRLWGEIKRGGYQRAKQKDTPNKTLLFYNRPFAAAITNLSSFSPNLLTVCIHLPIHLS